MSQDKIVLVAVPKLKKKSCKGCVFESEEILCGSPLFYCCPKGRKDRKDIIWVIEEQTNENN